MATIARCSRSSGLVITACVWLGATTAAAETYYVDASSAGDDHHAGTASAPWSTITHAADTVAPGDTVVIVAGRYSDTVTLHTSGTASGRITVRAAEGASVVLSHDVTLSGDYVTVQGLELAGASMRIEGSHCEVIGNYIHDAGTNGVYIHGTYLLIRGNRISNNGSAWGNQITTGWNDGRDPHHYVIEQNDVSDPGARGEDFMQYMSHHGIIRDNHFHELGGNGRHNDIYQSGGGEHDIWILDNTFEHLNGVQYFMPGGGERNQVWRGNAFWGAIGWGINGGAVGMWVVANTFGTAQGGYGYGGGGQSYDNIYNDWGSEGPYWADSADYNLVNPAATYGATRQPHDLWAVDPHFVDFAGHDFRLAGGSPCIDAGRFLTTTTADGSGNRVPVQVAQLFVDGFGIADGDLVQLEGSTEVARVVAVDYAANVLTLDRALTWMRGQGIGRPYAGPRPDIGAYELGHACTDPTLGPDCGTAPPDPVGGADAGVGGDDAGVGGDDAGGVSIDAGAADADAGAGGRTDAGHRGAGTDAGTPLSRADARLPIGSDADAADSGAAAPPSSMAAGCQCRMKRSTGRDSNAWGLIVLGAFAASRIRRRRRR